MNHGERLYQAIGEADDEMLERLEQVLALRRAEAVSLNARKKRQRLWGAAAASLIVAAAAIWLVVGGSLLDLGKNTLYTASSPVIDRPSDSAMIPGMMTAPQNGEVLFDQAITMEMEKNRSEQTEYFVAIDLFQAGMPLDLDSAETRNELERLQQLGLHVGYAEAWAYEGAGEQRTYTYLAGFLTAEQLKQWEPSEKYGYAFRFATNGDGSPVSAQSGIRKVHNK